MSMDGFMNGFKNIFRSPNQIAENIREQEKEQWRLYQEIKKEGWLKSENLDKLNPWRFSEEHINSMPDEEFDELCFRAAQKETKWAWKWALIIFISIFGLVFGYYYIFDPSGLE